MSGRSWGLAMSCGHLTGSGGKLRGLLVALVGLVIPTCEGVAQAYQRIPVVIDGTPLADPSFAAARDELLAIAVRADRNALNGRVGKTFFWDADHGGAFNQKRSAAANLAAAFSLDTGSEGWRRLRTILSVETATPRQPGSRDYCLPPRLKPQDEAGFDQIMTESSTDAFEWGLIGAERIPVRAAPAETAAAVNTLSREAVRVTEWAFETPEGQPRWVGVVTPTGTKGFVDGRRIQTLAQERLCLRKDTDGVWRISGYIGGGD